MKKPRRTDHQREIMGIILREAGEGRFLSATEIFPMLSYSADVTFGALRKTIERLEEQELLAKERRGRGFALIPTERGYNWFRPARA